MSLSIKNKKPAAKTAPAILNKSIPRNKNFFDKLDPDTFNKVVLEKLPLASSKMLFPSLYKRGTQASLLLKAPFDFSGNNKHFVKELQKEYERHVIPGDTEEYLKKELQKIIKDIDLPPSNFQLNTTSSTATKYVNTYAELCDKKIAIYLRLLRYPENLNYLEQIIETYDFMYKRCEDIYYRKFDKIELLKRKYTILIREFSMLYITMLFKNNQKKLLPIPLKYLHNYSYNSHIHECYNIYPDNTLKQNVVSNFLLYYFNRNDYTLNQFAYAFSKISTKKIIKFFNLEVINDDYYEYPYTPTPDEITRIYNSCKSFILIKNGLKLKLSIEIELF